MQPTKDNVEKLMGTDKKFTRHFSKESFMQAFGLKETRGMFCPDRLFRKDWVKKHHLSTCMCDRGGDASFGMDHRYGFYRPGVRRQKLSMCVWFPYSKGLSKGFNFEAMSNVNRWAEQHKLKTASFARGTGWYHYFHDDWSYNGTFMVMLWDPRDFACSDSIRATG